MTTITFPAPGPLMSMNERDHWRKKAERTKVWRTAAWAAARPVRTPVDSTTARRPDRVSYGLGRQPPSIVTIHLPVPDKRRRDPHNYFATVKPIIDGLVDAGLWPDDTRQWVTTTEPVLEVGAKVVTVELRPR